MKRSRWYLGLLLPLSLVAAGCGDDGDDAGPAGTPVPTVDDATRDATDDGTGEGTDDGTDATVQGDWILRGGHLDGEEITLVDDWNVTMSIEGDRIGGTAACNSYGGSVAIGDEFALGGSFVVGELSWTEMGCEPEVMELEQRFLAALGRVDSYELADTLSLAETGVGTGLRFDRVEPVADTALVGTTWQLDTLIEGDTASNSPGMDAAFLTFSDDGTLVGSTGCRRLEGEWMLSGATIQIPILSAFDDPTAGVCAPESEALDGDIISVVESGSVVEIEGNRLTLTAPGGDGLSFVADGDAASGSSDDDASSDATTTAGADGSAEGAADAAGLDADGGVDGPIAYGAHRTDDGGEEALLEGVLAFDEDGCVRVDDVVLLWPFGTRWQAEPPAVLADGLVLVEGARIAAGGGFHDVDDVGWWTENDEVAGYLRDCGALPGDGVFVIQHPVDLLG